MGLAERQTDKFPGKGSAWRRARMAILKSPDEDQFVNSTLAEIRNQISASLHPFLDRIQDCSISILTESRNDFDRWSGLLESGSISKEEYCWLIQARLHLSEMNNLRSAGLSVAQVDELRIVLVKSITSTVFRLIGD
jgi:hypothetical protein